jgi:hypothetical protein
MLISTDLVLESILETQLKFKILHSCELSKVEKKNLLLNLRGRIGKIFFKIIHTIVLKKVLSSKINNRIVTNYFKKILTYSIKKDYAYLEKNKYIVELEYLYTLAINSLYEISTIETL